MHDGGVLQSGDNNVRLLDWPSYNRDCYHCTPVCEACQQMIRRLNNQGESTAVELLVRKSEKSDYIGQLVYDLYALCVFRQWVKEPYAHRELIDSRHAIFSTSVDLCRWVGRPRLNFSGGIR